MGKYSPGDNLKSLCLLQDFGFPARSLVTRSVPWSEDCVAERKFNRLIPKSVIKAIVWLPLMSYCSPKQLGSRKGISMRIPLWIFVEPNHSRLRQPWSKCEAAILLPFLREHRLYFLIRKAVIWWWFLLQTPVVLIAPSTLFSKETLPESGGLHESQNSPSPFWIRTPF